MLSLNRKNSAVKKIRFWSWYIVIGLALSSGTVNATHHTFVIGSIDSKIALHKAALLPLKKAYQRLNIPLEIDFSAGNRSIFEANQGSIDGLLVRTSIVEKDFTNLVRVEPPVITLALHAYSIDGKIEIYDWDDLRYYETGFLIASINIAEKTKHFSRTHRIRNSDTLVTMLLKGRLEVILLPDLLFDDAVRDRQLSRPILPNQEPLEQIKLYHYLHKKHAEIARNIGNAHSKSDKLLNETKDANKPVGGTAQ